MLLYSLRGRRTLCTWPALSYFLWLMDDVIWSHSFHPMFKGHVPKGDTPPDLCFFPAQPTFFKLCKRLFFFNCCLLHAILLALSVAGEPRPHAAGQKWPLKLKSPNQSFENSSPLKVFLPTCFHTTATSICSPSSSCLSDLRCLFLCLSSWGVTGCQVCRSLSHLSQSGQ